MRNSGVIGNGAPPDRVEMVRIMATLTLQAEKLGRARRNNKSVDVAFLVIKNLLFWGSIGLSCYGIYRLIAYLAG